MTHYLSDLFNAPKTLKRLAARIDDMESSLFTLAEKTTALRIALAAPKTRRKSVKTKR